MSANSRPPLVGILIPAFNSASWIAATIRSALAQTWPRKEIIIVDDGSTDDTLAVARSFASGQVAVATQPNQGAAAARNTALSMSQADVIQWLDADDLLARDKIARQMAVGAGPRTVLSSAWGTFLHRPATARFSPGPLWSSLSPVDWLVRKLGHNAYMPTATWLVSRSLTNHVGAWDTRLSCDDDGEYFARVIAASDGVAFVPDSRVMYRMSGCGRLSHIDHADDRKLTSLLSSMLAQVQYLRAIDDSERVRRVCVEYLQRNLICYYPRRPDLVAQLRQLAAELGGRLEPPRLPRKYDWIRPLFGWEAAKRMQAVGPAIRWSIVSRWDKMRASRDGVTLSAC
jgi:glycosyltransferase involved in cell wall biosynthesis